MCKLLPGKYTYTMLILKGKKGRAESLPFKMNIKI
jgi:hypothetical protein